MKTWYAVYTKPNWERKVSGNLTRKKIENYCPLNLPKQDEDHRKKVELKPLFMSYVFVQANEETLSTIKKTNGVLNLVYWLGKPAVIREEEISTIRCFLSQHPHVALERSDVQLDEPVKFVKEPIIYEGGHIVDSIKVTLPSLGFTLAAEIAPGNVELVPTRQYLRDFYKLNMNFQVEAGN